MPYQRQQKSVWDMILTSDYIGIRAVGFIDGKTRRKEENSLLCDHSPPPPTSTPQNARFVLQT